MLNFSQVTRFARRLVDASNTEDLEGEWKKDTSQDLVKSIRPPVHSGDLAASVRATEEGVSMLDYWQFLEYGTVHMAAQPFVRPAVNTEACKSTDTLAKRVIDELT